MAGNISIQRLNLDSSWIFTLGETKFLVDPWLVGSEVDGFSWFNEQWHVREPVTIDDLPSYDFILLSQSYEDHCHMSTLNELKDRRQFVATGKAAQRISAKLPWAEVETIPDWPAEPIKINDVEILSLHPGRKIDPIYYAVVLAYGGEAIVYASHGFTLNEAQAAVIRDRYNVKLLITTFTHFKLPALLGGDVNPGKENALTMVDDLQPDFVIGTHDEQKIGKGLISKLAKVTYPDFTSIEIPGKTELIIAEDYQPIPLS